MNIITVISFICLIPTAMIAIECYLKVKELENNQIDHADNTEDIEAIKKNMVTVSDWNKLIDYVNQKQNVSTDESVIYEMHRRIECTYGNLRRQMDALYMRQSMLADKCNVDIGRIDAIEASVEADKAKDEEVSTKSKKRPTKQNKRATQKEVMEMVQRAMNNEKTQKVSFPSEDNL